MRFAFDSFLSFNTQPPEGGWIKVNRGLITIRVSTHSRPKAAGFANSYGVVAADVSTHSRPKAAGPVFLPRSCIISGFNTQPPEGGWGRLNFRRPFMLTFQHTAARRRLGLSRLY